MKKLLSIGLGLVILLGATFFLRNALTQSTNETTTEQTSVTTQSEQTEQVTTTVVASNIESNESTTLNENLPLIQTTIEQTTTEEMAVEKNLIQTDLPETVVVDQDDNKFSMHRLLDKPTIINVWASWCPPCREEMPYFYEQYQAHSEDVRFIMLNATLSRPTETVEEANKFLAEFDYDMPVYYDLGYNNQVKLETTILPYTIVINPDGTVDRYPGQMSEEQLATIVASLTE